MKFQIVLSFLWASLIVSQQQLSTTKTRLATYDDFQHGGFFLSNIYSFSDEFSPGKIETNLKKSELDILDHEVWWVEEEKRSLVLPTLVYKGDDEGLLYYMSNHNNWDRSLISSQTGMIDEMTIYGESIIKNIISNFPMKERNSSLFLCGQTQDTLFAPYTFTVLGDSHTGAFDVAALKMKNMNVTTIVSATMYGLKNFTSTTQAAEVFRNVLIERRQFENIDRNILVFNLGDCDVQGLGWRKYLSNETEGMKRSLLSFSKFLRDYVEINSSKAYGYGKVIIVLVPPSPIVNQSEGRRQGARNYLYTDYNERVAAINKFNHALTLFCKKRQYCSILKDIRDIVWNAENNRVYRPYVNTVRADTHLIQNRIFGVLLEQLRSTINAQWCVEEDNDAFDVGSEVSDPGTIMLRSGEMFTLPLTFEPIMLRIRVSIHGNLKYVLINVVHYLTPGELIHQIITTGKYLEKGSIGSMDALTLRNAFKQNVNIQNNLENMLIDFLGVGWGRVIQAEENDSHQVEVISLEGL